MPIKFKQGDKIKDLESYFKKFSLQPDKLSIESDAGKHNLNLKIVLLHVALLTKEFTKENLIVDTPFYKGFTIGKLIHRDLNFINFILEYDDARTPEYKIKMMQAITYPPSAYGKDPKKRKEMLKKNDTPICDHRDDVIGDDVTLYYPGFQKFIEGSNDSTITLEREDYEFAKELCTKMSKYFCKEKERQDQFKEILRSEFKSSVNESKKYSEDISIDPKSCVFIEVKNESGKGGEPDSYAQVIAYYVQSLEDKNPDRCPAPAYLLELVGPHLFISGAVYAKYIFVDRLVDPVWLVPHQNEEATIRIARILKALKDAIREIQRYYERIVIRKNKIKIDKPEFPIFQSFDKLNEGTYLTYSIRYQKRMKRHMFKGTLTYNSCEEVDVIIKFTERYCREAHDLMYRKGPAPKLIHYQERVGGTQYTAVVVEYIDNIMHLDEYLEKYSYNKSHPEPFQETVKVMHDYGFCHGKLTSKNIVMEFKDQKYFINIVNYEWAGRIGEARYPFSADIPDGIEPGDLISKARDRAQLASFFSK